MKPEEVDTYDKRSTLAAKEYPEDKSINGRVRKFEAEHRLTAFTPKEILAQRRNAPANVAAAAKPIERPCPQCERPMFVKGVCPSCEAFAQGMRTHWICSGCGAEQYSKKDHGTWIKELSQS